MMFFHQRGCCGKNCTLVVGCKTRRSRFGKEGAFPWTAQDSVQLTCFRPIWKVWFDWQRCRMLRRATSTGAVLGILARLGAVVWFKPEEEYSVFINLEYEIIMHSDGATQKNLMKENNTKRVTLQTNCCENIPHKFVKGFYPNHTSWLLYQIHKDKDGIHGFKWTFYSSFQSCYYFH